VITANRLFTLLVKRATADQRSAVLTVKGNFRRGNPVDLNVTTRAILEMVILKTAGNRSRLHRRESRRGDHCDFILAPRALPHELPHVDPGGFIDAHL
jgi:hypothetical protein